MLQDSCKVTPRLLEKVYGSLRKRQKGKSHIFTPSPPAFYLVPVLFKFLQISDDLLAYWLKVNGYSLPHQFLFHVVITMNKEVAHIRYLPPFQVAVSLAKLESQHIGSLADNHNVVDYGMIRPLIGYKIFHAATFDVLEYRVNGLQDVLQTLGIVTLLS